MPGALGLRCKSLTDAYKGARFRQPVPIENASRNADTVSVIEWLS